MPKTAETFLKTFTWGMNCTINEYQDIEDFLLQVIAPAYKAALFGSAGGR